MFIYLQLFNYLHFYTARFSAIEVYVSSLIKLN